MPHDTPPGAGLLLLRKQVPSEMAGGCRIYPSGNRKWSILNFGIPLAKSFRPNVGGNRNDKGKLG
jgi:hypothetical protein